MGVFAGLFARARKAPISGGGGKPQFEHEGSPQFLPGVEPAGTSRQEQQTIIAGHSHPAIVTPGFHDNDENADASLNYGFRQQPDVGGALNYAFENYALPLQQPAGPFMVARHPISPIGSGPLQMWPVSVPTGAGLFPGQVISQPLLNPQGPDSGIDIYN